MIKKRVSFKMFSSSVFYLLPVLPQLPKLPMFFIAVNYNPISLCLAPRQDEHLRMSSAQDWF